jgi:hypothetical protein
MLFTKKIKFSLIERQIKEEILSDNGTPLLKINLKYPEIQCQKKDPLRKNACEFYKRLSDGLIYYAKNDLLKSAKRAQAECDGEFIPYSVVMRWENTYESEKYLSILLEISISDGLSEPFKERKTQVWERKFGTKTRFSEFFDKKDITRLIEAYIGGENKKRLERDIFTLSENKIDFHIRNGGGYIVKSIPASESINKNLFSSIE